MTGSSKQGTLKVHNFNDSLQLGDVGEVLFSELLKSVGKEFTYVGKDKKYQPLGIDFIVDGITYDLKFDLRAEKTKNLAVETVSKRVDGVVQKQGWLFTSQADYILYLLKEGQNWRLSLFTIEELKSLEGPLKKVPNRGYESEIKAVPLSSITCGRHFVFPMIGSVDIEEFKGVILNNDRSNQG